MSKWKNFEEFVRMLTIEDHTQRTPLSGGAKHEEDIIGNTLVCQCKQTEKKNFHILKKDFTRLLEASELLNKFPLFFSQSSAGKIMSIPIDEKTEDTINILIGSIIIKKRLEILLTFCKEIKDERMFIKAKNELQGIALAINELSEKNKRMLERIRTRLMCIEDSLMMYNLFDENPDKTKN